MNKTNCRSHRVTREVFTRNKFDVEFIPLANLGREKHPLLGRLAKSKILRPLLYWGMRNFGQIGLVITRREA